MRFRYGLMCGALVMLLTACGDGTGTGPGKDELTQAEVDVFLTSMSEPIRDLSNISRTAEGGLSGTIPCTVKGQILASGSFSADSVSSREDITYEYKQCKQASPRGPWILTGSLKRSINESYDMPADVYDFHDVIRGRIDWDFDGRRGGCDVDVTLDQHGPSMAPTSTLVGTVCAVDVTKLNAGT